MGLGCREYERDLSSSSGRGWPHWQTLSPCSSPGGRRGTRRSHTDTQTHTHTFMSMKVSIGVSSMVKVPLKRAGPTSSGAGVRSHMPPESILKTTCNDIHSYRKPHLVITVKFGHWSSLRVCDTFCIRVSVLEWAVVRGQSGQMPPPKDSSNPPSIHVWHH